MALPNTIDHSLYPGANIMHQPEGQYSLVRFTNGPPAGDPDVDNASTVWLFDSTNKTYLPFLSWDALKNAFPTIPEANLHSHINNIDTSALSHDDFKGTFLTHDYGIQSNGLPLKVYSTSGNSTGTALSRYGQQAQPPDVEENAGNIMGTFLTTLKRTGAISEDTFNKYAQDPTTLGRYATAALYGGYGGGDVYRDIKAKELSDGGNKAYDNYKAIDDNVPANQFYLTPEGNKALSDTTLTPPSDTGMSQEIFDMPLLKISGNAFKTLIPPIDWTDPKYKEEADKIQAGWFDTMNAMMTATTAQSKSIADQNYADFLKSLQSRYGIQLSNNARDAYNQITGLFDQGSQRGIANSGVIDKAIARKMQDVRKNDSYLHQSQSDELEANKRQQLLQNGTPDQIRSEITRMNSEDAKSGIDPSKYRSVAWGLVPSQETKDYFSLENLKKVNPDMSDADLQKMRNLVVDSNGNYMSQLYQGLYQKQFNMQNTGVDQQKANVQQQQVFARALDDEKHAYEPYTSGNPLSNYQPTGSPAVAPMTNFSGKTPAAPGSPINPATPTGKVSYRNQWLAPGDLTAAKKAELDKMYPDAPIEGTKAWGN